MIARTVIDFDAIAATIALIGFFAVVGGLIWATNEVIRFEIRAYRAWRDRRAA